MGLIAFPASFVNSYIEFLNKRLSIYFRTQLSTHFNELYLKNMIFYQLTNIDSRVSNPDQTLTADIEKWAQSLSVIYSNITKPILDIILFSTNLAKVVSWKGPFLTYAWYIFSGCIMKIISPPVGKLTAIEQKLEGDYRACHSGLVKHSEEIAFYKGNSWEKQKIEETFNTCIRHERSIMEKKLFMGFFDSLLVKYGAVLVGYVILGLPVFGPGSKEYMQKIATDSSKITQDYIKNSSLLINLAKAIGKLVISYKDIQHLAGYTILVSEVGEVLTDLNRGRYIRKLVNNEEAKVVLAGEEEGLNSMDRGKSFETEEHIEFIDLPIITPNNDVLI